jgi:hypothetical protein
MVMSTGDGQSHQIVVLTHVRREQRSYVVDSLPSLKAAAGLVRTALDTAGIPKYQKPSKGCRADEQRAADKAPCTGTSVSEGVFRFTT